MKVHLFELRKIRVTFNSYTFGEQSNVDVFKWALKVFSEQLHSSLCWLGGLIPISYAFHSVYDSIDLVSSYFIYLFSWIVFQCGATPGLHVCVCVRTEAPFYSMRMVSWTKAWALSMNYNTKLDVFFL